jgi:site-specific DNA-cytosine methylase
VRNALPRQFPDFVERIEPKAVIIETVAGMRHEFREHGARSPFDDLRIALSRAGPGDAVQTMALSAMHHGVPQPRPRGFLAGRGRGWVRSPGLSPRDEEAQATRSPSTALLQPS